MRNKMKLPVFQFSWRSPVEVEAPPQKADGPDLLPGGGLYKIVYFLQLEEDTTFTLARKEIGV